MDANQIEKIIIDLKKKYDNIFATTVGNKLFLWRLLKRKEYEIIIKSTAGNKLLKEELVCQTCILYPDVDFSIYKAGIPSAIAEQILEESGFRSNKKSISFLTQKRNEIEEDFTLQVEIVIAAAFPQYKFEDMKEWDIEKLLSMLSKAEWKLKNIDNLDFSFDIIKPESKTNDNRTVKQKMNASAKELAKIGIDPILMLGESFKEIYKKPDVDFPLIMGKNWDNEVVLDVIRKSLHK